MGGNKKTKDFKDRQCRYCPLADKRAFRKGWPCCPLPNPRIFNGHCRDKPAAKAKKARKGGEE